MLRTVRSSITIVWFSRTSRVVSLCRWSRLRSVIRAWTRATLTRALARFAEPFSLRAVLPLGSGQRGPVAALVPRVGDLLPGGEGEQAVEPGVDPRRPSPAGGPRRRSRRRTAGTRTSARPRPGDTVTVDGAAPSGSGRDHTMSSGSVIFARVSRPSRKRNALVVYSADARDFFLHLNVGYLARLAKKFVNAPCRCRSACWSGTDDTSLRNASSSVLFPPGQQRGGVACS